MRDAKGSPNAVGSPHRWRGRAWLGAGWATFEGEIGDNRPHAHHALQLALGLDGPLHFQIGSVDFTAPGVLIAADVTHALNPGTARLLYLERESRAGRQLAASIPHSFRSLDTRACHAIHSVWPGVNQVGSLQPVLQALNIEPLAAVLPAALGSLDRLRRVIESLPQRVHDPLELADLAREAALSPGRFGHNFKAITGLAVRPYLRWLRLARALEHAADGATLSDAAQAAGFSDAAHCTRTMRRHFGVTPSDVIESVRRTRDRSAAVM